ncbi:ubiquitin carboxyl-terminal hydrolase MINDY-1 isoform X1 [Ahaetulla prasina]|uniref:ubiquitin carboxyl-terminal hydrolase MINDY-1 isoform X1 n=2 Tax=Ahaetulla prasina TaxID=499056 RepID=UPI002649B3F5|nr:ubiquitin carboxyl-terminal hydrolase MINDY-1 isoform X1 [Ahaetulla prasina]XP_058016215.1 ubiquitin carboxyl-terminal hydrolase MINDY-1 isoform X1 [Ahaetulla prasina]XP_058016216.1 ubiquitin carboxyl-terminal hydrolase MINDY-1 isoform X1 [Ahaetulla prasina]XP_058016217.1 ubiquitin carboxyl-terminal hydrolase MINDY-1 isoform X1 [Ahaetulla prasina]
METQVPAAGEAARGETEPTESGLPQPTEAGVGSEEVVSSALPPGAAEETPPHLAKDGGQSVTQKDDGWLSSVEAAEGRQKEGPPSPSEEASPLPASPVPASCSPAEDAPKPRPSPASQPKPPDFYCVKWITWKGERTPVIMQSENGPCPLLAIMNILFLQWKVKLPAQKEVVTSDELMAYLGDCILSIKPQDQAEAVQLNFQQNVNDAMMVLSKLSTGLDVNVRFTGVSDFEYTPECIVFDLLNVPLYHGWLVDPQIPEVAGAVSKLSYNQLVEKIITCKHSSDPNLVTEGLIAEQFLESTASQLTYHGLCELTSTVKEGELSVFFRNNHFSAMIKHKSHLYLLVTDQGFLNEDQVTWESLHNVDGDSCFCDAEFHLSHTLGKEAAGGSPVDQRQVDQDYMIALSLQRQQGGPAMSDLELAQQLQQEEYQQPPPPSPLPSPAQGRSPPAPRPAGEQRRQRQKADTDCIVL